jgi:hypothetical protein
VPQNIDKLYAKRQGAAGTTELFLDGKGLMLYGNSANAYLQLDASSIDAAIEAVHSSGSTRPAPISLLPSRWTARRRT